MNLCRRAPIHGAVAAALLAAAPAAFAQTSPIRPGNARAISGEWTASRVGGLDRPTSPAPTLRFNGRDFVGGDGCNHIGGRLARAGAGRIEFGPVVSTKMACAPEAMRTSTAFHSALKAARAYRIDGATMQIADARGEVVLVLERAP